MSVPQTQLRPPSPLTSALAGKIVIPEHARFDEARRAWNLAIDQRPGLRRIKAAVDPENIIRANHPIPPAHPPSSYFASKTNSSLNTGRSSMKPPSPNS